MTSLSSFTQKIKFTISLQFIVNIKNNKTMTQEDLSIGEDCRGDEALFIDESHFLPDGWSVDEEAKESIRGEQFFRVIDSAGFEQHGHGWVNSEGEVLQWG